MERIRYYDARFLNGDEFIESLRHGVKIAVVSGGDGYAIAESFRGKGFARLKDFISRGGLYVGICAGAYLPLPSRVKPFDEFNISTTKIENIDCSPRAEETPRVSVPYGSCSIVHPVRGEVEISGDDSTTHAPLHGGPILKEPETDAVLMRYTGFGADTEFQVERESAERMMLGHPAVIECVHGEGRLLLFGPHLEHPKYLEANHLLRLMLGLVPSQQKPKEKKAIPVTLAKSLADLKVATMGLEGRYFMIGRKMWDASRFLELLRAIEKRSWTLGPEDAERILGDLDTARGILLQSEAGRETDIDEATTLLLDGARACVDAHFRYLVGGR